MVPIIFPIKPISLNKFLVTLIKATLYLSACMKKTLLFILSLFITGFVFSQQSDYIILKKRNNRTLKTYYQGSFIRAETYNGFTLNGFIRDIRNDSLIIRQEETQLFATDFGSVVDTLAYTLSIDYRQIKKFFFGSKYTWGRKKGFAVVTLPVIMMIGGSAFVVLELINTGYRNDGLKDQKKLMSLGIGLGVAATGFLIKELNKSRDKVGGRFKVVYMKVEK